MTSTDRATRTPGSGFDLPLRISTLATGDIEDAHGKDIANVYGFVDERDSNNEWTDTWSVGIRYIVTAVNAHDALVEALERIVSNSEDATAVEVAAAALQGLPTSHDRATAEE